MATLGTFVAGQVLTAAELNDIGTWTTFTPVFTNFTLGNGTVSADYCQINDVVFVRGLVTLGSTSSVSGAITILHPSGLGTSVGFPQSAGLCRLRDASGSVFIGQVGVNQFNVILSALEIGGGYLRTASISSTVPFTWTSTDSFQWQYFYERA